MQRIALRQYVADDDDVAARDDRTCSRKTGIGPRRFQPGVREWSRKYSSYCLSELDSSVNDRVLKSVFHTCQSRGYWLRGDQVLYKNNYM